MRVATLVALGLAAAAVHAPAAAAAARPDTCFQARGRTVALNPQARLLTRGSGASAVLLGCRRARRPVRLASNYDDDYVESRYFGRTALAGRWAAYAFTSTDVSCKAMCPPDYETTTSSVYLVDLRTMKQVSVAAGSDFVLTQTGALAWITPAGSGERVVMAHHEGQTRELARGTGIDDASLQASRSRVTWLQDGRVAGAALG